MSARKGIILVILLILGLPVMSQKSKPKNMIMADYQIFHFGYSIGLNTSGFTVVPKPGYTFDLLRNPGININLITDYRLNKYMDLRFLPGIQFGQRDLTVRDLGKDSISTWSIESICLDFPILVKYRSQRVNNYAPYVIGGINPRVDLQGSIGKTFQKATRLLRPYDLYVELGVGCDFYIAMAKVAMELKFSVGMLDLMPVPTDNFYKLADPKFFQYVSSIDQIFSRMVVLSFHVEQSK